jgi:hypothetical protein
VAVTARRTKQDYAQQMKYLVDVLYPDAEVIIEGLAKKERRSISSMINTLIDEALAARGINLSVLNADTIAELVQGNYQKLLKADVKNLKAIADGERPNDIALAQIAEALEMKNE